MMWGYGYGWNGSGMLMMSLGSILVIVLIALLIWAVVRGFNRKSSNMTMPTLSASEILRQRYARGEMNADTFEQMRSQLETETRDPIGSAR